MAKISGTFDHLWTTEMDTKAKALGVIDGDLHRVRSAVKNTLISAGWAQADGTLLFSSKTDKANALKAAAEVLALSAHRTATDRRVVKATVGSTPTKSQVLLAHTAPVAFSSTSTKIGSFSPALAAPGEKCPRCSGSMEPVGLVNERGALYCPRDRVVLPLPADVSVRY